MNGVHFYVCSDSGALLVSVLTRIWKRTDTGIRPTEEDEVDWMINEGDLSSRTFKDTIVHYEHSSEADSAVSVGGDEEEEDDGNSAISVETDSGMMNSAEHVKEQEKDKNVVEIKWYTDKKTIDCVDNYKRSADLIEAFCAIKDICSRINIQSIDILTVHMYDGVIWALLRSAEDGPERDAQKAFWSGHLFSDDFRSSVGSSSYSRDNNAVFIAEGVSACIVREKSVSVTRAVVRGRSFQSKCTIKGHVTDVPILQLNRDSPLWSFFPGADSYDSTRAFQIHYEGCWMQRRLAVWLQPFHVVMDGQVSNFIDSFFVYANSKFQQYYPCEELVNHNRTFEVVNVRSVSVKLTYHPDMTSGGVTHSVMNGMASLLSTENSVLDFPNVSLVGRKDCSTIARVFLAVLKAWSDLSYFQLVKSVVSTSTNPVFSIVRIARDAANLALTPAVYVFSSNSPSFGRMIFDKSAALATSVVRETQSLGSAMWNAAASVYHSYCEGAQQAKEEERIKAQLEREQKALSESSSSEGESSGSVTIMTPCDGPYEPIAFRTLFSSDIPSVSSPSSESQS